MNNDFQLCADFGLADKVREYASSVSTERLQVVKTAIESYINFGVMPFTPATIPAFCVFADDTDAGRSKHNAEVMRDTIFSILAERGSK